VPAPEQYYIASLSPEYNILKVTGNSLGYKHTKEAKAKISQIHLGKIPGPALYSNVCPADPLTWRGPGNKLKLAGPGPVSL
jgi:hypothetical protein